MTFEEKKEIALKNWYETDCKSPESITVKEAYSLGFNRACQLLRKEIKTDNLDTKIKTLEGQKIVADTISLPLFKEELKLLITGVSYVSTNDQVVNLYQKLTKKLEALEKQKNERRI